MIFGLKKNKIYIYVVLKISNNKCLNSLYLMFIYDVSLWYYMCGIVLCKYSGYYIYGLIFFVSRVV